MAKLVSSAKLRYETNQQLFQPPWETTPNRMQELSNRHKALKRINKLVYVSQKRSDKVGFYPSKRRKNQLILDQVLTKS
jgi:hypothetical protein